MLQAFVCGSVKRRRKMKVESKDLPILPQQFIQAKVITYSNGRKAIVGKKVINGAKSSIKKRCRCPPVNRNEPMTKKALKRTENHNFGRLFKLDLIDQNCRFVSLTICKEKYNIYNKVSKRFKHFIGEVREKVKNHFIGTARFIELQKNGFFHIHCILVFDSKNIDLTCEDLHKMWGWGLVDMKAVKNRFGLFDYLTNLKHNMTNGKDNKFTRYPKGARIIYISPNLPRAKSKDILLTPEEYSALQNSGEYEVYFKSHQYYDPTTQKKRNCIDKKILIQKNKK